VVRLIEEEASRVFHEHGNTQDIARFMIRLNPETSRLGRIRMS
jgi:hypothetical protein